MTKIAFIGLGTMGGPMAQMLRKAGHYVMGMDISDERRAAFEDAMELSGAPIAEADVVITMLPEAHDVTELHDTLVRPKAKPGTLLIDCSTIDVETTKLLAEAASAEGLSMLDAPVSGGPTDAEAGRLRFMVGGPDDAFQQSLPILNAMGSQITHFGPSGAGQAAKACRT